MYSLVRAAIGIAAVGLGLLSSPPYGVAQELPGRITIAATDADALQSWGDRVHTMLRSRELIVRAAYDDRMRPELRHEVLSQQHRGVPVYGAELRIHRSRGVIVSILAPSTTASTSTPLRPCLRIRRPTSCNRTLAPPSGPTCRR